MKIAFLIHNIYGIGGTNRTVLNLAETLAARHEVEIVSVLRRQDSPQFAVPAGVTVRPLVDLRPDQPDRENPALLKRSTLIPPSEEFFRAYSALTDQRIRRYLAVTDADVVVGTRPGLALCVARLGRADVVRIAQEHMTQEQIDVGCRRAMAVHYGRLDAAVDITGRDAQALRDHLGIPAMRVLTIPNSVPDPGVPPSDGSSRIVMAAGRITAVKRYDLMVHAFATVARERPDWSLRIYGVGPALRDLRSLVYDLGLYNNVFLMGRQPRISREWAKASIATVASDLEPFGMTLVEAMRCGVPVVSTDCPNGPAEIVNPDVDGLLVPVGDADALAGALLELIDDPDRRLRMGKAALENSRRYDPSVIGQAYERLFSDLVAKRRAAFGSRPRPRPRRPDGDAGANRGGLRHLLRPLVWGGRSDAAAAADPAPVARTTVEADGSVVVTVEAPAATLTRLRALVCRERRDRDGRSLVRVAFGAGATPTAVLPVAGAPTLGEGRWDVYVEDARRNLTRLRDGQLDNRGLLAAQPAGPVIRNLPYRTADGHLAIRTWVRYVHAETGALAFGDESIQVKGQLYGAVFDTGTPTLLLVRRQDPASTLTVAGSSGDGTDFAFRIPLADLVARRVTWQDDWDLWLADADGKRWTRLARLLDDVHERKPVFRFPMIRVDDPSADPTEDHLPPRVYVRPYYTAHNELSLYLTER